MTELEKALASYDETLKTSQVDLDSLPHFVRSGREGQKRQALRDLKLRHEAVSTAAGNIAFGLVLVGSREQSQEFVRIASEEAEVLSVDVGKMYQRIVDRVAGTMGSYKTFGTSQFGVMILELGAVMKDLGLGSMNSPQWKEPVDVGTDQGLYDYVRTLVESTCGLELVGSYVRHGIGQDAIEKQPSAKTTLPVIVTGLTPELSGELAAKFFKPGRNLLVQLPGEITREFVLETFNRVKQSLKSTKKSST